MNSAITLYRGTTSHLLNHLAHSQHLRSLSTSALPELVPGAVFTLDKTFTAQDVQAFCRLTGDDNPIHGTTHSILPGMMTASLFPAIIGSTFHGAVYVSQTLRFRQPALFGDALSARITVEERKGRKVTFDTVCTRQGQVIVEGKAIALLPKQLAD